MMTEFVAESLTEQERDVLANMLMRSLRGSWAVPYTERAELLRSLAEVGLSDYDNSTVISRVDSFLDSDHRDGRIFRYVYEDGPLLAEQTDKKTARLLIGYIPVGDLSWNSNALDRRFDDD